MRRSFQSLVLLMAVLALSVPARAEIRASMAAASTGRGNAWELVEVRFTWPELKRVDDVVTVTLQDARGGPVIARAPLPSSERAVGEEALLLVPLPLVAPSELPRGQWPVRIGVESGGEEVEGALVNMERMEDGPGERAGVAGAVYSDYRVVVPVSGQGSGGLLFGENPPAWSRITERPLVAVPVGLPELLSASPLLFAGCDAILITPETAGQWTHDRALALVNAGVQLVSVGDDRPGGDLSRLVWDRVGAGGEGAGHGTRATWICPARSVGRPAVIEAGLARLPMKPVDAPPRVRAVLLGIATAALVVLLLARGLFHRREYVLLGAVIGLAGLTAGLIVLLQSAGLRQNAGGTGTQARMADESHVAWEVTLGNSRETVPAWTLQETLSIVRPLFRRTIDVFEITGTLLFPAAPTPREYFALRDARLSVDVPSARGLERLTRLEMPVPPRRQVHYLTRRLAAAATRGWTQESDAAAAPLALVPPLPSTPVELRRFSEESGLDLQNALWIERGYVHPAQLIGPARGTAPGELFTRWARQNPARAASAAAWYELRFDATHTYLYRPAAAGGEAGGGTAEPLLLIDFGPARPDGPP